MFRPNCAVAFLCALLVSACADPSRIRPNDVPVRVDRVGLDPNNVPVMVLQEHDGPRWLPIWIGAAEAHSIALQIEEVRSPRPNTHDLARRLIQGLEGEVERVVVTELRQSTYYAVLMLRSRDGLVEIDSRPSDAIAIALRTDAPIFVRAGLFAEGDEEAPQADDDEAAVRREI